MREFRLLKKEYPGPNGGGTWFNFADYGALLDIVERLKPKLALEFGPGSSTLALIEGGVQHIDTYENNPNWLTEHRRNLAVYPQVNLRLYEHSERLDLPGDFTTYDFAFVDGPQQTEYRRVEIEYALARARAVACHDSHRTHIAEHLERLKVRGYAVELSGDGIALIQ